MLAYDTGHPGVLAWHAVLLVASSVPLAIWAAAVYQQLRRLGSRGAGPLIGFAGGVMSAASIASCGLLSWTAQQSAGLGDVAVARVLTTASFAAGAAGFVVPLGLLIVGVAVPALIRGLLPRPIAWTGLIIGILSLLSVLHMLSSTFDATLVIGRFLGLAWIIATSALLPNTRPTTSTTTATTPTAAPIG